MDRHQWTARDDEGIPLALIDLDAQTVTEDQAVVVAALESCRLGLENARLNGQLTDRIRELSESHDRTETAIAAERWRIQQELTHGPYLRLTAAETALRALELSDAPDVAAYPELAGTVSAGVETARSNVLAALDDVRGLARRIYPALLSQAGLGAALRALPEQTDLPVTLCVAETTPALRLRPAVEFAAYAAISDLLSETGAAGNPERVQVAILPTSVHITCCRPRTPTWPRPDHDEHHDRPGVSAESSGGRECVLALGGTYDVAPVGREGAQEIHIAIPLIE